MPTPARLPRPTPAPGARTAAGAVLALQRAVGNGGVARLLAGRARAGRAPGLQRLSSFPLARQGLNVGLPPTDQFGDEARLLAAAQKGYEPSQHVHRALPSASVVRPAGRIVHRFGG
jgi:hypothetical protein